MSTTLQWQHQCDRCTSAQPITFHFAVSPLVWCFQLHCTSTAFYAKGQSPMQELKKNHFLNSKVAWIIAAVTQHGETSFINKWVLYFKNKLASSCLVHLNCKVNKIQRTKFSSHLSANHLIGMHKAEFKVMATQNLTYIFSLGRK